MNAFDLLDAIDTAIAMKFLNPKQYQPVCSAKYINYSAQIQNILPNARIEHIGASSIKGAYSKGDLDIYVEVNSSEFESAIGHLTRLGFQEKAGTLRTPELCMLESTSDAEVAIQIVSSGSKFKFFLDFRDALNNDENLVREYNNLKLSLQGKEHSLYRIAKSKFIERVLALQ